ncbi:hypothetical protein ACI7RC_01155 [Brevibacillus sp. B_LB10_24]|uniref:hypothetical protein n=1 Tax=Brevibacillus sp. B_LB10_24 TaxID=3380645 RepID=UPI0038B87641
MTLIHSYLELGLIGMARGGQLSWFKGHFGAALLAGYFMNQEHDLPEHVKEGIVRTCESYRKQYPDWFGPLEPEEPNPRLMEEVISGLKANTQCLRTSGHGLALGVLALKALRERPDLTTPTVVKGLVNMLERTREDTPNRYWGVDNYFTMTREDVREIPAYSDTLAMARQAFAELQMIVPGRTLDGKKYFFDGEKTHGITHAHALAELERFGYDELVAAGQSNHLIQMHLNRQLPDFMLASEVKEPPFTSILSPAFWAKTYEDPHALKLPYAALALLKRLPKEERAKAELDTCKLLSILS